MADKVLKEIDNSIQLLQSKAKSIGGIVEDLNDVELNNPKWIDKTLDNTLTLLLEIDNIKMQNREKKDERHKG